MIDTVLVLEEDFSNNNYYGTNVWTDEKFRVLSGMTNVLLSAPHSVNQIRNEDIRDAEKYTGGLVRYLSNTTSSYAIFQMFTNSDPNYDNKHDYKDATINLVLQNDIRLLIDVHSSLKQRPYDVNVAINNGINIQDNFEIIEKFKFLGLKHDIYVDVDNIFKAEKPQYISNIVARETNIPCIELEINEHFLDPVGNPQKFAKLVKLLEEFIMYFNYKI